MPELLLFAMCEKSILDNDTKSASLINIVTGITVEVASDEAERDPEAISAFPWSVVAVYRNTPEDEAVAYQQKIEVITPSGSRLGHSLISFTMTSISHTNTIRGNAFPVGEEGTHLIELAIRNAALEDEWRIISTYPVEVSHVRAGTLDARRNIAPAP